MFTIIPPASGSLQISRLNHPGVQARNLELFPFFSLAFINRVTEVSRESPREGTGEGKYARDSEPTVLQGLCRLQKSAPVLQVTGEMKVHGY